MERSANSGFETPEEAALSGFPARFATVVGRQADGDLATVWLLTNDEPPFEPYEVRCERQNGRWYERWGSGGFSLHAPADVLARARRLGW